MVKFFIVFFLFTRIASDLNGAAAGSLLIAEQTTGGEGGYSLRTSRIWHAPDEIARFRTELGNLPSISNSADPDLICETFPDTSTGKYLFAPLNPETVSDLTMGRILRTNGICNCIEIAIWTPSGSYMLHCPPQQLYLNADGEIVMGAAFIEFKTTLQEIPLESKAKSKVYLGSSMFADSFKLIKEQLIGLGYTISGIAVPNIIQVRRADGLDYYIGAPLYDG